MRKPSSPPPAAEPATLSRALGEKASTLRRLARRALRSSDADAVHDARVATRRLKAALDLLEPFLPARPRGKLAGSLRALRRALGPIRDHDVMLQHLAEMPAGRAPAGAAWVARRLRERRLELGKAARKAKARRAAAGLAKWDGLAPAVGRAEATAGPRALLARAVREQARAFAAGADRLARAKAPASGGNGAAHPAGGPGGDVHDLRVAGKRLRYTLELAAPLGGDVPASVGRDLKKLQDALGLWHDYAVLTAEVLRLATRADLPARRPELFGEVLALACDAWRASERHLAAFRRLWDERGARLVERVTTFAPSDRSPAGRGEDTGG